MNLITAYRKSPQGRIEPTPTLICEDIDYARRKRAAIIDALESGWKVLQACKLTDEAKVLLDQLEDIVFEEEQDD